MEKQKKGLAIAALVLGVGMTVDANIITYERIRQELYKGHSVDFKDRNRVISISNQARRTSKRRAESKRKKI